MYVRTSEYVCGMSGGGGHWCAFTSQNDSPCFPLPGFGSLNPFQTLSMLRVPLPVADQQYPYSLSRVLPPDTRTVASHFSLPEQGRLVADETRFPGDAVGS